MNASLQSRISSALAVTGKLAAKLFHEMAPKVLFFFVAFGLIFLLFKLFVAQYSIEFPAFAEAAVAALVLGKVIPLLDWAQSRYRFENYRRITVILGKTLVYAMVVVVLRIGERMIYTYRQEGNLGGVIHFMIANANGHRFFGLLLLISLVVGAYLTAQEIDHALGEGKLYKLFFERPVVAKA